MKKIITSEIIVAYSLCPRKAFLLLEEKEKGKSHEYVEILEKKKRESHSNYIKMLQQKNLDVQPYNQANLKKGSDFFTNATLQAEGIQATCSLLTKVEGRSSLGRFHYEPTIFVGTCSISKEQSVELAFVSHVLGQVQGKDPAGGRIIGADEKPHKVKLGNSNEILIPLLEPVREWQRALSPESPPLILNKNCSTCQFQDSCRNKAEQEDNLSLLNGVTPKVMRQYEKKGIFTVRQLSYLFKPRKRKKRSKNPPPVIHKLELQALAIRERKIYLQDLPELTRKPAELFLDIEGIPDQQYYYLIGLLVCDGKVSTHYFFWADTIQEEEHIGRQLFEKIDQYPSAPIYHYGSYEPRALEKLGRRYGTDSERIKTRLVNINSFIYGKIYFPVRSNKLKEIGGFIGSKWTSLDASGLQSLVWRYRWEETGNNGYRQTLITYNQEDCQALKQLTDELSKIKQSADILSEVDFADKFKQRTTEVGQQIHNQFKTILRFAHFGYDKKKIHFRQDEDKKSDAKKKRGIKKGYQGQRKRRPKPTRIIQVPQEEICNECGGILQPTEKVCKRLIIDIVSTKNGVRKTITESVGTQGYCAKCMRNYSPPSMTKNRHSKLYGHGFKSWLVYHRVAMRLPYESISEIMVEQFGEKILAGSIVVFIRDLAQYYSETERIIIQHLLESPVVHADETRINIKGANWYAWVFTDGKHVVFKLTETREATIVHEFLVKYNGILVTDFYSGYDSVECQQQKCWVHLIRDINDDLRETPFDTEFEVFVSEVRDLIVPIMEAIQKYGLKKRNLNKFKEKVERFFKKVILEKQSKSDLVIKYQKRFVRYEDSLFTFLESDGVPWHNNTAERAIRHIAKQRAISSPFHESGARSYLRLLGIKQTCRFQDKSFFKFLFSEETDLDQFKASKR